MRGEKSQNLGPSGLQGPGKSVLWSCRPARAILAKGTEHRNPDSFLSAGPLREGQGPWQARRALIQLCLPSSWHNTCHGELESMFSTVSMLRPASEFPLAHDVPLQDIWSLKETPLESDST